MKPNTYLFDLIHALSKSEKRFFKLQTNYSCKSEANNYILLFDAIDKMSHYDEDKLRKKLKAYHFSTQLTKTKYLLYNLILKTLNHLRHNASATQKLANDLRNIELLYQKSLYTQSFALTQKAQKKATRLELNDFSLAFANWEIKLLTYLPIPKQLEYTQQLIAKSQLIATLLDKEHNLNNLLTKAQLHCNNSTFDFSDTSSPLHWVPQEAAAFSQENSFLSIIYTYEIQAIQAQHQSQFKKAIHAYEEILLRWKANQEKIPVFRNIYLRTISGYIHCSLNVTNQINYDALLHDLKQLPARSSQEQQKMKLFVDSLGFIIQVSQNNLEVSKLLWMNLSETLEAYQHSMQTNWLISLKYHICIFHFLKGDYQETRHWVAQINNSPIIKHSPQIQNYCKLIDLISLYELQDYDALEYDIRKTYRYLREKRQYKEIESVVLSAVQKLLNAKHIHEQAKIFTHLHQSLQYLEQENIFQLVGPNVIFQWVVDKLPQNDKPILN